MEDYHPAFISRINPFGTFALANHSVLKITAIICFICLTLTSYPQYLPTIEPNKTWAVSGYYIEFDYRSMYEIYLGDTVIVDDTQYTTLLLHSEDLGLGKFGLIREDTTTGKVWFRSYLHYDPGVYIATSEEVLVADYSLETGDEFEYTYFLNYGGDSYFTYTVTYEVIETGMVEGRRYVELNSLSPDLQNFFDVLSYYIIDGFESPVASVVPLRFIEGIGPSFSFVSQCAFEEVYYYYPLDPYVLCASIQDSTIWHDPFVAECSYVDQLPFINVSLEENSLALSIYPNPVQNQLFIHSNNYEVLSIEVFNTLGQKVLHAHPSGPSNAFDLQRLSTGTYIVHIHQGEKKHARLIQKL